MGRGKLTTAKVVGCKLFAIVNSVRIVSIKQVLEDTLRWAESGLQLEIAYQRYTGDLVASDLCIMVHYLETLLRFDIDARLESFQEERDQWVN